MSLADNKQEEERRARLISLARAVLEVQHYIAHAKTLSILRHISKKIQHMTALKKEVNHRKKGVVVRFTCSELH
jgi:hypothetical protein